MTVKVKVSSLRCMNHLVSGPGLTGGPPPRDMWTKATKCEWQVVSLKTSCYRWPDVTFVVRSMSVTLCLSDCHSSGRHTHTHTQAKWQSDTRTPLFTAHQRASNLHLSPWQPSWCASFFWGNRGPRKQRFLGGFDRDGDQSGTKDDFYQDCRPVQPLLPLLLKGKTCAIATWSQWIYCAFSKILLSYCIVGRASIKVACPWGLAFASNLE